MTFVVPFDGSELAEAALVRAVEYGNALDEGIAAVAVVPERKRYAREKRRIDENEPYNVDAIVASLRERVRELAPSATFEFERIREFSRRPILPTTSSDCYWITIRASCSSGATTSAAS